MQRTLFLIAQVNNARGLSNVLARTRIFTAPVVICFSRYIGVSDDY